MNALSKGILFGLTKLAQYEDFNDEDEDFNREDKDSDSRLKKALLTGAGVAALVQAAPLLSIAPEVVQTLMQSEKGIDESKQLLRKFAPSLSHRQTRQVMGPKIEGNPFSGRPTAITYNKNPYMTAHEVGHALDRKGLKKILDIEKSNPSFLKVYLSTLANEGKANLKGFGALQQQFGTLKAIRGLPTMLSNMADYLTSMPLARFPILKAAIPAGAILASLAASKNNEEDDGI